MLARRRVCRFEGWAAGGGVEERKVSAAPQPWRSAGQAIALV